MARNNNLISFGRNLIQLLILAQLLVAATPTYVKGEIPSADVGDVASVLKQASFATHAEANAESKNLVKQNFAFDASKLKTLISDVRYPSSVRKATEEHPVGQVKRSLMGKLGEMARNAIAPAKMYADLITRYHRWYRDYSALQKSSQVRLRDPLDILKEEYARVDSLLTDEACDGDNEEAAEAGKQNNESVDFIFQVLSRTIAELETQLDDIEFNGKAQKFAVGEQENKLDEEQVKTAMERVKRTAIKTAMNVAKSEMFQLAKVAMFDGLASYVASQQDLGAGGTVLSYIAPVVQLLGSASTPLVVSYMRNVEFRAALAVINQANPISVLKCA